MLETIMIVLCVVIVFYSRNLWVNYKILGGVIDTLDHPVVQTRLFTPKNEPLLQKIVDQFVFVRQHAPLIVFGTLVILALLYVGLTARVLSPFSIGAGSLIVAASLTWLRGFDPIPDWLFAWSATVHLTKAQIDVEIIKGAQDAIIKKIESTPDISPSERDFLYGQLQIVDDMLVETQEQLDLLIENAHNLPKQ